MLRFFSIVSMLMLISVLSFAQGRHITGTVTDAKEGSPLPGVTIKVKGTATGTVTKANGTYELNVPDKANTLVFSFVGYGDQEIAIGSQQTINAALTTGKKDLSEVIVVGYGTQVKRNLTGSISKLGAKDIENQPVVSLESAIQGKSPGVVIESGSGKLAQGIKVRVRGTSSISASSQPLYVVDGMPVLSTSITDINNEETNPMADINPNDIESIEVLKDASAAAIYGARASNGVILITTKKGRTGEKTKFEVNASNSWGKPAVKRGFLNAKEYVSLLEESAKNDGKTAFATKDTSWTGTPFATEAAAIDFFTNDPNVGIAPQLKALALGKDYHNLGNGTNWEDLSFRNTAHTQQIDVSASGGTDKTKFFVSGFYNNQEAVVINNTFQRYGGRLNLEHTANDKISLGMNMTISRSQLDRVSNDNIFSTPSELVAQPSISPVRDSTGALIANGLYPSGLYDAQFNSNRQVTFRTLGNVFLNYKIIPTLAFRSELGTDVTNLTENQYIGKLASDALGKGQARSFFTQNVALNTNNYFTFTPSLGKKHTLSATAGMSYIQNDLSNTRTQGELVPSDAIKSVAAAASITYGYSSAQRYTFLSYFFRANYAYKNKYLASFSVRSDGSSRFGPNNRYGVFPAGSVGWVISEEDFLKNSKVLNFLKVRTSYGLTGNAEIGENRYTTLLDATSYPQLPGFRPSQMGNPNLKWEKTRQFDVGLEFGFFNNRLSGEVDYYNKQTSDLLLRANLPYTTGFSFQYMNIGHMENKGVEILLTSRNIESKNFNWTTTLNAAYNKNRVQNIGGQIIQSRDEQRAVEGQPIGVFFMPKFLGVDPQTGNAQYQGADSKPTTDFASAPRVVVGKSVPDWTGGFTNTFSGYGFDLNIFFSFVQGNRVYNRAGIYQDNGWGNNNFDNQLRDILNRWQKPGDITSVPRLTRNYADGGASATNSRWLSNGSYIRLKSLTLGYSLPKNVISALKVSSVRVYAGGYNLWLITKYKGDPEINSGVLGNIEGGIDYYTVPQAKQITVGLNVKF